MAEQKHFYVFYVNIASRNVYERTCGTEERAREVVAELKKIYAEAFYTIDILPTQFYY